MRSIAATGSSVIFISHDIDEVMAITDRITVLRDGRVAGELETARATHDQVVEMIVGRSLARRAEPLHDPTATHPPYVRVDAVAGTMLQPTDFTIGKGEILGLTGLIGSGYEEVPYLVFGARPCRSGVLKFAEAARRSRLPTCRRAGPSRLDFALLPGDRQSASGVDSLLDRRQHVPARCRPLLPRRPPPPRRDGTRGPRAGDALRSAPQRSFGSSCRRSRAAMRRRC